MKPVQMYVFGTTFHDLMGIGIRYAQRGATPYHVGVMFLMEDGSQIGFEGSYGKNGWIQFDFPAKAQHYSGHANAIQGRTIQLIRLPISSAQVEHLFIEAKRMVQLIERYPRKVTLVWKLLHQRRGWPMLKTSKIVDCSEGVARLLHKITWDLRDSDNTSFDSLSPSEVWERIQKDIANEDAALSTP